MTVEDFAKALSLDIVAGLAGKDKEVTGCYVCDLLSWVIAHAEKGDVWITIHTHLNVMAVAVLKEISCIIIPEGIEVDAKTLAKADHECIPILTSCKDAYKIIYDIAKQGVL